MNPEMELTKNRQARALVRGIGLTLVVALALGCASSASDGDQAASGPDVAPASAVQTAVEDDPPVQPQSVEEVLTESGVSATLAECYAQVFGDSGSELEDLDDLGAVMAGLEPEDLEALQLCVLQAEDG